MELLSRTGQAHIQSLHNNSFCLNPHRLVALTARIANDLRTLLQVCTEINGARSLAALQQRLLELIFDVVPAESGAILLLGGDSADPVSTETWSRRPGAKGRAVVRRSVIERVVCDRAALLDDETDSVLAVPLFAGARVSGVIYLQSTDEKDRFDEGHVRLLMGVAGPAAAAIESARQAEWLKHADRPPTEIDLRHNMVGESPRMRELCRFIARVARTDSTVLIRGESGTGKEMVARAVHLNSARAAGPFIAINCAALSEALLESELFGHEKGAFTGAIAQKRGKLETADGGTLFLDEVGELAPILQAKLLRVLQEREFERVGGTRSIRVNIRLIAATNRDLEKAILAGAFRQDLYYRLNVLAVTAPPLRERRQDIPLLAGYFAARCGKQAGRVIKGLSVETRECLMQYDWPGNVRELENAIERAVVLGTGEVIAAEDLPGALQRTHGIAAGQITEYRQAIQQTKRHLVRQAFERAGGRYAEAARLLGVHPNNLHRLLRGLDLELKPAAGDLCAEG